MPTPAFESFSAFLKMGSHGGYVWSAWGLGLICLIGLVIVSLRARASLKKQLAWQQQKILIGNQKLDSGQNNTQ